MSGGLYIANVTVHVFAALIWLGGMFFFAIVGAPVLRHVDPPELRVRLFKLLGERARNVGWIMLAVLVVTGALNLHFRGLLNRQQLLSSTFWATRYGRALGWKLAAVSAMLIVSALHDFIFGPAASRFDVGSPEAETARRRASRLGRINALLGVIIVVIAVRLARGA